MGRVFFHEYIRPGLVLLSIFTLLLGVVYPGATTLLTQMLFHDKANGSLIYTGEKLAGSELIGQQFTSSRYFWSRPSMTPDFPYNAAQSAGSNYSANNGSLKAMVKSRTDALKVKNGSPVPIDLVTSSASGLDPHISVASAYYQVARIAKARNLDEKNVRGLVDNFKEGRQLGFLGETRVNVLKLNLALDAKISAK